MRRSHTKSRKGCLQCKTKHVKCNEVHPRCGNCTRLEIGCSFSTPTPSPQALSPSTSSTSYNASIVNGEGDHALPIADLELLHNFTLNTAMTLVPGEDRQKLFYEDFTRLGFRTHYLLHSILALSGLHLYTMHPTRTELITKASAHQNAALRLVQPTLANMTEGDSITVFAFSGLTATYAMAEVSIHTNDMSRDPVTEMISCFQLTRGIKTVIEPFWVYLSTSIAAPALKYTSPDQATISPQCVEYFTPPRRSVLALAGQEPDAERRAACVEALDRCFDFMITINSDRDSDEFVVRLVQTWPIVIRRACLDMMAERHPLGLILLAYFAVLMGLRSDAWWMRGTPARLLSHLEQVLTGPWLEYLHWPRYMIFEGGRSATSTPRTGS